MDFSDEDAIGLRLSESTFWFDPFSIPQYELLVKEGHITQEQADEYRSLRQASGLPMTFEELKARPCPEFEWLLAVGGPSLAKNNDVVDLDGERWVGKTYAGQPGILTYYPSLEKDGFLSYEIRKPHSDKEGVHWEANFKVPHGDRVYARSNGQAVTFAEALAVLRQQTFQPEPIAGLLGYPCGRNGQGWVTAGPNGGEISLTPCGITSGLPWRWEYWLPENSVLWRLARMFGENKFQGYAATREVAITDALRAEDQVLILAAELLGNDSFAAGLAAGRAELKAAIAKL